jgi:hypothetical protein
VVADLHHCDEEQDPDPHQCERSNLDPHQSESSDPDPHQGEKSWIRISERDIQTWIRTIALQIRNVAYLLHSILF